MYAHYLGLDFDQDVFPNLSNKDWWEADYGVKTVDGKEIGMSIKDAFRCLVDTHRTFQLAQGISETVKRIKSKKDTIIGIDAGTGTGVLSILMIASGVDKVYAVEINDQTYYATQDLLRRLQLDKQIILLKGDATEIHIDQLGDDKTDVLVSENLSTGLMDEPQYAIINHLSPYLFPDAPIIPFQGQLSVSLGFSDWEGIYPSRREIAERRLKKSQRVTKPVLYAVVESRPGMRVPIINNSVTVPIHDNVSINTLLIHTRFQINEHGFPFYLEPDTADFLGKTHAFRLGKDIFTDDHILVNIKYEAGRRAKELIIDQQGNKISLNDPYPPE